MVRNLENVGKLFVMMKETYSHTRIRFFNQLRLWTA